MILHFEERRWIKLIYEHKRYWMLFIAAYEQKGLLWATNYIKFSSQCS